MVRMFSNERARAKHKICAVQRHRSCVWCGAGETLLAADLLCSLGRGSGKPLRPLQRTTAQVSNPDLQTSPAKLNIVGGQ